MNRWEDNTSPPDTTRFKAGLAALSAIVRDAEANNKRVRALGGGWSLSKVATTDEYLINTKLLNAVNIGFKASNVRADFNGDRSRLVFTQCGTSVMELNQVLEPRGLSLPTSGASNGQTLCGAISTGTHGSNRRVGAMHDFITGLHLIAGDGRSVWLEPQSRPVVTEAFAAVLGAELVHDDALFHAAVVGLGSFGLVHALAFEAVPLFTLEAYGRRIDHSTALSIASTLQVAGLGLERAERVPDHMELVFNPYAGGKGAKGAYLRYMYQLPEAPQLKELHGGTFSSPGQDVLGLLGSVTSVAPSLVEPLAAEALSRLKTGGPSRKSLGDTFGATGTVGFVMSSELGVALEDTRRAVETIIAVSRKFPWAGLVAVRYVRPSAAFMAFTRFSPITATIELPAAGSPRTAEAFERIWDELGRQGIPFTWHWGQMLHSDPQRVQRAFGKRADDWKKARQRFLSPRARRMFSNGLLIDSGLAD
jgi:FAD/FMN-containing dehydrogenase